MNVALAGASDKPERYSYLALQHLLEKGHTVFPVHPRISEISGTKVFSSLKEIPYKVHTLTLYLAKDRSDKIIGDVMSVRPQRIIFNPGAENEDLEAAAVEAGITVIHACTILLLETGQF